MSLVTTSISEQIQLPPSHHSTSSDARDSATSDHTNDVNQSRRQQRAMAKEKNKIIAASTGAVVTSLTMTPFDVIKTRLQTQPPPATPPLLASKLASTSSVAASSSSSSSTTFFSSSPSTSSSTAQSLFSKFAPRTSTSFLPSSGTHLPSASTSATVAGTIQLSLPHRPPPPIPTTVPGPIPHLTGFFHALKTIAQHEGLSAMWRGTIPALAMSVPGQVVYMIGYDWGRRTLFDPSIVPSWAWRTDSTGEGAGRELSRAYLTAVPLLAGGVSRTLVAVLISPMELIRTQLQSSPTNVPLLQLVRTTPLMSAWRGLPPTLWRDVPFSAVYWAGYEVFKRALTGGKGMGEGWKEGSVGEEMARSFVAGAGSGMIAATLTNPFDVVKTRRQSIIPASTTVSSPSSAGVASKTLSSAVPTKTFPLLLDIVKKEGPTALWSGLTPRLAKVGLACGIMVGCYEGLGSWLD
ncbi:mitochondrial carrier [Meredithblackwellia eburnea MCA 4105]